MEKERNTYKIYEIISTGVIILFCVSMFVKFLFF